MPTPWHTVRVFISSTFKDMQAERDHLVRFVFPKLREELLKRRIHLIDVDLRWGVTSDQDAFDLCMDEIDRCRPRFICILGGRYGWVPPPKVIDRDVFSAILSGTSSAGTPSHDERSALERLYALKDGDACSLLPKPRTVAEVNDYYAAAELAVGIFQRAGLAESLCSITASEIHYGALGRLQEPAFRYFYFRDESVTNSITEPHAREYREPSGSMAVQLLELIKKRIMDPETKGKVLTAPDKVVESSLVWFEYPCSWDGVQARIGNLKVFGERVYSDLLASIDAEFGTSPPEGLDEFAEERMAMEVFIETRTERYILGSRQGVFDCLQNHAEGVEGNNYLCLVGSPGSGKSALLCQFAKLMAFPSGQDANLRTQKPLLIIPHFVGASAGSTDVRRVLRRLCHEIAAGASLPGEISQDFGEVRQAFPRFLEEAASSRHVVIVIDAINRLDPSYRAERMRWLPDSLPPNVRIILSTIPGPALETLKSRRYPPILREMPTLTSSDSEAIINGFLSRYRKTLEPEQHELLLEKEDASSPLYLLAGLEELRTLGTYEEITDRIHELPGQTKALFDWILNRLEQEYSKALVRAFTSYIALSRSGMAQPELATLLRPIDPEELWPALQRMLRPYLASRGELVDFFHGQLSEAVVTRHLSGEARQNRHRELADYHLAKYRTDRRQARSRTFTEVTYHLHQYALDSGDCLSLFALVDDRAFQREKFGCFRRPEPVLEDIDYALDLAVRHIDSVRAVHYTVVHGSLGCTLTRAYLSRLVVVARENPELARAMVGLIPGAGFRRVALMLLAWLLASDPARNEWVRELLVDAAGIHAPASVCQVPLLLEMIRELAYGGVEEVVELTGALPNCSLREIYMNAWAKAPEPLGRLGQSLLRTQAAAPRAPEHEIAEFTRMQEFVRQEVRGISRMTEERMFDRFGPARVPDLYLLMAAEAMHSGNAELASLIMNRAIYVASSLPKLSVRALCGLVESLQSVGETDLAEEHADRVRTFVKGFEHVAVTEEEKGHAADLLRELMLATEKSARVWRPRGANELFARAMAARRIPETQLEAGPLTRLSNARFLLASGHSDAVAGALRPILAETGPEEGGKDREAILIAAYALACTCGDEVTARECCARLPGLNPETLFTPSNARRWATTVMEPLVIADNRCSASVALCLRLAGLGQQLLEFLRASCSAGAGQDKSDAILAEVVRLPGLTRDDLRCLSNEILVASGHLVIPSGLGMYYYPGLMLWAVWTGMICLSTGVRAALAGPQFLSFGIILLAGGLLGGLLDLIVWRLMDLWRKPELGRRWWAEAGTFLSAGATALLAKYCLGATANIKIGIGLVIALGLPQVVFLFVPRHVRGLLFSPLSAKFISAGTAVSAAVAVLLVWLFSAPELALSSIMAGIFLGGTGLLSLSLNILPKRIAVVRHYGIAGDFLAEPEPLLVED